MSSVVGVYGQLNVYKALCEYQMKVIQLLQGKNVPVSLKLSVFKSLLKFAETKSQMETLSLFELDLFHRDVSIAIKQLNLILNPEYVTPSTSPTFEFIFPIDQLD